MTPEERKRILTGKGKRNFFARRPAKGKRKEGEEETPQEPMTLQQQLVSWGKTLLGALLIVMVVNGLLIQSFVVPTESMENEVLAGDFVFVNRFIYGGSSPQTIPFLNIPLPYFRLPGLRDPEVGDVIVFIYPGDRDQVEPDNFEYYLKRCVAVSGDTVEVRDGIVYLNGRRQEVPENAILPNMSDPRTVQMNAASRIEMFPSGSGFSKNGWGPMRVPKEGDIIPLRGEEDYRAWNVFIQREGHETRLDGQIITIDDEIVDSYTVERNYVFGVGDNRDNSEDSRFWGFIPVENVVGTPLIIYWSWDPYVDRPGHLGPRSGLPERSLPDKFSTIRWDRILSGVD